MIALGCDHTGYELKQQVREHLESMGYECKDYGCGQCTASDYPIYGEAVGRAVASGECELGVLICGTGVGISLCANKVKGVRAGLAYNTVMARLAREHNDARIVALGGRMQSLSDALAMVRVFLETPFSNDPRHVRRLQLLDDYENQHCC